MQPAEPPGHSRRPSWVATGFSGCRNPSTSLSGSRATVLDMNGFKCEARSSSAFGIGLGVAQRYNRADLPSLRLYEALKELEAQVICSEARVGACSAA